MKNYQTIASLALLQLFVQGAESLKSRQEVLSCDLQNRIQGMY